MPVLAVSFLLLGKLSWKQIFLAAVFLVIAALVIYARSNIVQDLTDNLILSKAGSYSGIERLDSVVLAAGYFVRYPILGVGWGSVTSHDLVFKLLANTGLAGLLAFGLFIKSLTSGLYASAARAWREDGFAERSYWAAAMLVVCVIFVVVNMFTEFAYVFGDLWFVFGMCLAVSCTQTMKRAADLTQAHGFKV
jgi:hypothetical protein